MLHAYVWSQADIFFIRASNHKTNVVYPQDNAKQNISVRTVSLLFHINLELHMANDKNIVLF